MAQDGSTTDRPASVASGFTSSSLLERVKAREPEAWQRLADLYGPLIYRWSRQSGLRGEDSADVVQEVLRTLTNRIGEFEEHAPGSFRAWLRTITHHKVGDSLRRLKRHPQAQGGTAAHEQMQEIAEAADGTSVVESAADSRGLSHRALSMVRSEFTERTWQAFWLVVAEGRLPADVAAQLGMSVPAVYMAKSRVLCRLRQELDDPLT